MKANEGHLYPLDDSLLFLPKPTLHMPFSDISVITFSRVGGGGAGASRTFDMVVTMKKGTEHPFNNIAKEEHTFLETYFKESKVRVKNEINVEEASVLGRFLVSIHFKTS
jgi:structure-specific recognition protein 1